MAQSQIVISKEKFFPLRALSGMSSSQHQSDAAKAAKLAAADSPSVGDDTDEAHPEGPNIGFGSDPSWLSKARDMFCLENERTGLQYVNPICFLTDM